MQNNEAAIATVTVQKIDDASKTKLGFYHIAVYMAVWHYAGSGNLTVSAQAL